MPTTQDITQAFGQIGGNPVFLEPAVSQSICEGMNILLSSFQALYLQYQKHHFVVEGTEFFSLHQLFEDNCSAVQGYTHELGERLNGLGGVPAASFATLAELCSFTPEADGCYSARTMLEHDLEAEQSLIGVLRSQAAQAESLGDRATRFMYEKMLLETEERAFHLDHFLAQESLTLGLS